MIQIKAESLHVVCQGPENGADELCDLLRKVPCRLLDLVLLSDCFQVVFEL